MKNEKTLPVPRACPEQRRRGGRRPGAGAPTGNLNALKHGRRSHRFVALAALIMNIPHLRRLIVEQVVHHAASTPEERRALRPKVARAAARYARLLAKQSNWDRLPTLRPRKHKNKIAANNPTATKSGQLIKNPATSPLRKQNKRPNIGAVP